MDDNASNSTGQAEAGGLGRVVAVRGSVVDIVLAQFPLARHGDCGLQAEGGIEAGA
jgi:hypothetical protein